jgi:ribonuclease T2
MRLAPLVAAMAFVLAACAPSSGEDNTGSVAARGNGFDFYVLSLAWSPTYCEEEGPQANRQQCGANRDFAFIVHGLWPQFERGYPEFCASDEPQRVPDALVATVLDIMPSAALIGHQWRKHGTCSGLGQGDYLRATREAFDSVAIPTILATAQTVGKTNPEAVERAFIEENPGLAPDGIAVTICLTKDLGFRACLEVDERACRTGSIKVPAAP